MLGLRVIVEYRNIEVDSSFMNYVFGENDLETFYGVLVMVCCLISDNPQVITRSSLESAALVVSPYWTSILMWLSYTVLLPNPFSSTRAF
jgi:hypothetical protein